MQIKLSTITSRFLVFCLTIGLFLGCTREEREPNLDEFIPDVVIPIQNPLKQQQISFEKLPKNIRSLFDKGSPLQQNRSSVGQPPIHLSDSTALKISTSSGRSTYTIAIEKTNNNAATRTSEKKYFDNLIIKELSNGEQMLKIVRYTPESQWFYSSQAFNEYSGEVAFYELDGTPMNNMVFYQGTVISNAPQKKSGRDHTRQNDELECLLVHVATICSGLTMEGDDPGRLQCTEIYDLECSTGGGGGGGDHNPPNGDGSTGGGGDGSHGGGSTGDDDDDDEIETAPLLTRFGLQNNIDDPCAFNIFDQLQKHVDDPLKPEVQILDESINLNFSQSILNLFNGSAKFDYIVKDEGPSNPNADADTSPVAVWNSTTAHYEITTRINPSYINTATRLSIARTMIHESAHALLVYKYRTDPYGSIRQALDELYSENNNSGITHHEFMGQYVNAIAYSLKEWDSQYGSGINLGWDYYHAMAFGGLFQVNINGQIATETDIFVQMIPNATERQNIANIILNEFNGDNDALGNKCP